VRAIGCSYVIVATGLVAFGIMFIWAGRQLAPSDTEAARAFRTDRSCTTPLIAPAPPGNCAVVDATVLVAEMRRGGGFSRTPSYTPVVYLRFADGTMRHDDLDGGDGRYFAESVRSGAPARAQLFRGQLVRVASGDASAETESAPDVSATSDSEMPWVGGSLIAIAALFIFAGVRAAGRAGNAVPR
jgi:hypothetical protein